jgi:hypothetical protein
MGASRSLILNSSQTGAKQPVTLFAIFLKDSLPSQTKVAALNLWSNVDEPKSFWHNL